MSTLTLADIMRAHRLLNSVSEPPMPSLTIIESYYLGAHVQVRFPRSKKKRIVKKWAKDTKRNWKWIEDKNVYRTPFGLICSPSIARELRKAMQHG